MVNSPLLQNFLLAARNPVPIWFQRQLLRVRHRVQVSGLLPLLPLAVEGPPRQPQPEKRQQRPQETQVRLSQEQEARGRHRRRRWTLRQPVQVCRSPHQGYVLFCSISSRPPSLGFPAFTVAFTSLEGCCASSHSLRRSQRSLHSSPAKNCGHCCGHCNYGNHAGDGGGGGMGGRLSRSYWDFNARSAPASKSSRSTREVAIHAEGRVCSIYLDIFVWGAFRVLDLTTL